MRPSLRRFYDNYIQWLTIYEVIDALWRKASLVGGMSLQEAPRIVKLFTERLGLRRRVNELHDPKAKS